MHVRMSNRHTGNVPLILNSKMGDITAQWNTVFDNWFFTVATNVKDMLAFHADKWSKMFGTSTFNTQPDDKIKQPNQQPTQLTRWVTEDNVMKKEEELWQQMLRPNSLIWPNQSTMPPTRTHSQATSKQIKWQSEFLSQELRHSPRASQEPIVKKSNHSPAEPAETQNQPESRIGPLSSAKKKLQWGDSKAQSGL